MIPTLLWRCPLCATNDVLRQRHPLFQPIQVHCLQCGAIWQVRRIVGDDYRLVLTDHPGHSEEIGVDLPLAQWYARMKETIVLSPISDPAVTLLAGERLYLASKRVILTAAGDDPLFFADAGDHSHDQARTGRRRVGRGQVFLTNQRLIWQSEAGGKQEFPLERVNSVYALYNRALLVMVELRLYQLRFRQESLLKWVTYFAYVAQEVAASSGHRITTSNF